MSTMPLSALMLFSGNSTKKMTSFVSLIFIRVLSGEPILLKLLGILHPAYPGSVYHATKCLDALLWQFYQKNDQLRVTDLHQGIVWGTNTPQTIKDERLINRFDYDGDYGTVLNRFLMQGAMGVPLTVYGTGGQTRAFIHVTDTCKCIEIAINNPPAAGDRVEIFNQVAETRRVRDVAALVAEQTEQFSDPFCMNGTIYFHSPYIMSPFMVN